MTENKRPWTAGPWTLDSTVRTAINAPDNKHIAMVSCCQGLNGISAEEHKANATLLAAAPALYEALDAQVQWEADLILSESINALSTPLMEKLLEVQRVRNAALRAANPDAFESAEGEGE